MNNHAASCGVLLLAACASGPRVDSESYLHMICVDPDGAASDLEVSGPTARRATPLDAHVQDIAEHYWRECIDRGVLPLELPVSFVIHGGLVEMKTSIPEAIDVLGAMTSDASEPTFPIFVNWDTGLLASYANHLFWVRSGRRSPWYSALPGTPFVFLMDVGRGVTRFLWNTVSSQRSDMLEVYRNSPPETVPKGWRESAWIDTTPKEVGFWSTVGTVAVEFVPGLARIVTAPMLDTIGYTAYGDMVRRARVLFLRDEDFDAGHFRPTGALSLLMAELLGNSDHKQHAVEKMRRQLEVELAATKGAKARYELQRRIDIADRILTSNRYGHENQPFCNYGEPSFRIFAHSMGTLVANSLVQRFGHEATFEKIVYMGAACSIRDFADEVLPYIAANPECEFYDVCLHPADEFGEWSYYGTMPHGSLLVWIDSYVTEIRTELDYTLGRWNNVMRALPVMAFMASDIRRRIHVRGFGASGPVPHSHGELNDREFAFWRPEYYDVSADPATKWEFAAQVRAERVELASGLVDVDVELRDLQRAFDRSLGRAESSPEVAMIVVAYWWRAASRATELGLQFKRSIGIAHLLKLWWEQALSRMGDIRRDG